MKIKPNRMHKVLKIQTENAFCLHSKERVPYHIIIEVAYEPVEEEKEPISDNPYISQKNKKDDFNSSVVGKLRSAIKSPKKQVKSSIELADKKKFTNKLPKKKFFEQNTNNSKIGYNSMDKNMDMAELDQNFLNDGLTIA